MFLYYTNKSNNKKIGTVAKVEESSMGAAVPFLCSKTENGLGRVPNL